MLAAVLGSILAIGTAVGMFVLTKHLTNNNAQYVVVPKIIPMEQRRYLSKVDNIGKHDENSEWDIDEPRRLNTEAYLTSVVSLIESTTMRRIIRNKVKATQSIQNTTTVTQNTTTATITLRNLRPVCQWPKNLGPIRADTAAMTLDEVERKYPEVHIGGLYFPPHCIARQKVAVIVPYRNRQRHLPIFLNHIHPFLMKQQLEYGIFVVEQNGKYDFNRAKLLNVGFLESQKLKDGGWHCFIFHDIDLLPLDERNSYECANNPMHLSPNIKHPNADLIGKQHFGGVSALTWQNFTAVNGYSNKFWGWGTEDSNFIERITTKGLKILKRDNTTARYTHLSHDEPKVKIERKLITVKESLPETDGLSSLKYKVLEISPYDLFTHILVEIGRRY